MEPTPVKLMRLGLVGHEKPVVRVDADHNVDISDITPDVDEAFFGGDGMLRLAPVVAERIAAGAVHPFTIDGVAQRIGARPARPRR